MNELALSGLAIPGISGCMCAVFVGFWHYNRQDKAAVWFALAFACGTLGFLVSNYLMAKETFTNAVLNNAVYGFGIFCLVFGTCRAFNRKPPVTALGVLAALSVVAAVLVQFAGLGLNIRIWATNTVHGLMFAVALFKLRSIWSEHWASKAVLMAFTLSVMNYVLIAPLTTFNAVITDDNFFGTLYWRSMNVITVLSVVAVAGALIAVCVSRNIRDMQNHVHRDWLTGLLTRRAFDQTAQVFCQHRSSAVAASLVLIEIDDMKTRGTTYGRRACDELVAAFGEILTGRTRHADLAGRVGGGHFCLVLPGTDMMGAARLASRIKSCIRELSVPSLPLSHIVTASFGIAEFGEGTSFQHVYNQAQTMLAEATSEGGNRLKCAERPAGAGRPMRRENYNESQNRRSA
ncbi:MAG: GGDEF domain-containing protein [Henriciella sp.]